MRIKWGITLLVGSVLLAGCDNKVEQEREEKNEIITEEVSPEIKIIQEVMDDFFENYKAGKFDKAAKYLIDDDFDLEKFALRNIYAEDIVEVFQTLMLEFDVEIDEITIEKNKAVAKLNIDYYDLNTLLEDAIETLQEEDESIPEQSKTAEKMLELGEELVKKSSKNEIKLIKQDEDWKINLNNNVKASITSGLFGKHQTSLTNDSEIQEMQKYVIDIIDDMNQLFLAFAEVEEIASLLEKEEELDADQTFAKIEMMYDEMLEIYNEFEEISLLNSDTSELAYLVKSNYTFLMLSIDAYTSILRELVIQKHKDETLDEELLEQLQISALDIEVYQGDFLDAANEYLYFLNHSLE